MTSPLPQTDDGRCESVIRAELDDAAVRGIGLLATSLGFRLYDVHLAGCDDKTGLLERTATALGFPAYFGQNWDAWFDCLADLGWQPAAAGHVLLLREAAALSRVAPEALDTAISILEDVGRSWADRGVTFRVFLDTSR